MKIGVLLTAYDCEKYVERCLAPWLKLRVAPPDAFFGGDELEVLYVEVWEGENLIHNEELWTKPQL